MTTNDVHSGKFESKMDPYFTSPVKDDGYEKFRRTDRTTERSMLATTRPIKDDARTRLSG